MNKFVAYGIVGVVLLGFAYLLYAAATFKPYTSGPVHWHVQVAMKTCGQERFFSNDALDNSHLRSSLLHTHREEPYIHIEGDVKRKEDIALGKFMGVVGIPFSAGKFFEYGNGMKCPGSNEAGSVKMRVNGKENSEFDKYAPSDGDSIEIEYS